MSFGGHDLEILGKYDVIYDNRFVGVTQYSNVTKYECEDYAMEVYWKTENFKMHVKRSPIIYYSSEAIELWNEKLNRLISKTDNLELLKTKL